MILKQRGINPTIPHTVDENGAFTEQAPGFTGKRVINDKGEKGDANEAVIKALAEAGIHHRPRSNQASISALLALQEASILPAARRNGSLRWIVLFLGVRGKMGVPYNEI